MADETPEITGGPMPRPDDATEAVMEALASQDILPPDIDSAEAI